MMNNGFCELNNEEILETEGGVIPAVVIGAKIIATGILAGAGWRLGEAAYDGIKSLF